MPGAKYFLELGGSFLLGALVILASVAIAILAWPYVTPLLLPLVTGMIPAVQIVALAVIVLLVSFIIVYFATALGVFIKYVFKPMEVSKQEKGYAISSVKESGLRQKGKTKKRDNHGR